MLVLIGIWHNEKGFSVCDFYFSVNIGRFVMYSIIVKMSVGYQLLVLQGDSEFRLYWDTWNDPVNYSSKLIAFGCLLHLLYCDTWNDQVNHIHTLENCLAINSKYIYCLDGELLLTKKYTVGAWRRFWLSLR
jgi:hypothetical protein